MITSTPELQSSEPRLRLWPGLVIVALQWLVVYAVKGMAAGKTLYLTMTMAPIVGMIALVIWWLFASRILWRDKILVLGVFAAAALVTWLVRNRQLPQSMLVTHALPIATAIWVGWLLLTYFFRWPFRRAGLLTAIVLTWGYFSLVRITGLDGSFSPEFVWRWSPTAEERFLADTNKSKRDFDTMPANSSTEPLELEPEDWPCFRGLQRDGCRTGIEIETDWEHHPPRELWRRRVGPSWSSFAVVGDHLYTQEQRGEQEVVVCYHADTGKEIWTHQDEQRFDEVVAGPGPRATPTFDDGKIYALGASGQLNCLDAITGKALWSRNMATDTGAKVPHWGFAASPLVAESIVTVFAGGPDGKSMVGYHIASGEIAWMAGEGEHSYCSPQLVSFGGVPQILIATNAGLTAYEPTSGKVLWQHDWPQEQIARIVQPALINDSDVLIGTGMGVGLRRVSIAHKGDDWPTEEIWTTRTIKPYFNDLVVYDGHLYGFDGTIFLCVSLADGKAKWRARGYGSGQVLLLADQGILLILSEQGDVALVEASPDGHKELSRIHAIEGKTWNHPVVARGRLFVRNGEEAACYQLESRN